MIKTIKSAYSILKDNLIIVQPLILFFLLFGLVVPALLNQKLPVVHLSINGIIILAITLVFAAGWFYMIKLVIDMKDKEYKTPQDRNIAQFKLLKEFFVGIGEYFLPTVGAFLLCGLLLSAVYYATYKLGTHYLGTFSFTKEITDIMKMSPKEINEFLSIKENLTPQLISFYNWVMLGFGVTFLFTLLTLFYPPAIFYKTKNPIKAFWENIKFLFSNFIEAIVILFFLLFLQVILSSVNMFSTANLLMAVISLFLILVYCTYYVMLVFVYYEEKTKNSCDSGTECVG